MQARRMSIDIDTKSVQLITNFKMLLSLRIFGEQYRQTDYGRIQWKTIYVDLQILFNVCSIMYAMFKTCTDYQRRVKFQVALISAVAGTVALGVGGPMVNATCEIMARIVDLANPAHIKKVLEEVLEGIKPRMEHVLSPKESFDSGIEYGIQAIYHHLSDEAKFEVVLEMGLKYGLKYGIQFIDNHLCEAQLNEVLKEGNILTRIGVIAAIAAVSMQQHPNQPNGSPTIPDVVNTTTNADTALPCDNKHMTVLHLACLKGRADLISPLLKAGAVLTQTHDDGCTALHHAARGSHTEVALEWLKHATLSLGKEEKNEFVNARNKFGKSSLHLACEGGNLALVTTLLEHSACPNIADADGSTALHMAT